MSHSCQRNPECEEIYESTECVQGSSQLRAAEYEASTWYDVARRDVSAVVCGRDLYALNVAFTCNVAVATFPPFCFYALE